MNNIAKVAIVSLLNISSAYAAGNSIKMTCISTDSPSTTYNITYYPELNYTEIVGNWINARSRLYKVLGKDTKGHIIYLRTKAEDQTRTVYLAFGYSDAGDDVSAIRVVDKTINYDKRDKCYIVPELKPSQPPQEASSSPASPPQGPSSSPPKSESQLSPVIKKTIEDAIAKAEKARKDREFKAEKRDEAERKEEAEKQSEKEAEANKEWREKIEEARIKGQEYAKKVESVWSLTELNNPMTDGKEYTVRSTQLNGAGAIAEIEGTCKKPGEVVFIAVLNQTPDQETPIGLPDSDGAYIAGLKRINDDQAFSTHFHKDKFRNQLILSTLTVDKAKLEYEDSIETTWRILAQIETSRGQMTMKIPLFDENVVKLIAACSKQYENSKRTAG